MNVPANPNATDTGTPAEARRFPWIRRPQRGTLIIGGIVCAALAFLVFITGTIYMQGLDDDPYRKWPADGAYEFLDKPANHANAIVAVTCIDGAVHMEEKMLVKPNRANTKPSWYIQFYVAYDQSRADFCELKWKAFRPNDVEVLPLELMVDRPLWSMRSGISFDGLGSVSIPKNHKGGLAVLLINLADQPEGPKVKNGSNGIPAPGRGLLEGTTD